VFITQWRNRFKRKPIEWYRSYQQFSYLLTPSILSTETDDSVVKNNRISTSESTSASSVFASTHGSFPNRSKARVLIVGCGNSSLPFDMVSDGWTGGIVGVDFSSFVIGQMREKVSSSSYNTASCSGHDLSKLLEFVCADVTKPLPGYAPGSFDLILCKGTLDAILCSLGSHSYAKCFIRNCVQLLSPKNGVLALITTGNPDSRFEYLEYQNTLSYFWRHVSVYPLRSEPMTSKTESGKQPP
jgi:SAM-dependent methyltransferase